MMDVSGSMTDEQKEIVRTEAFWIDTWLPSQYDGIETRYIIHDAAAKEVDEHTFYHTRESGGTRISSAYKVCADLIDARISARRVEHVLLPVLRRRQLGRRQRAQPSRCCARQLLPQVQPVLLRPGRKPLRQRRVHPRRCEGRFGDEHETLVLSEIENKEAIYESIKKFLGKGKVNAASAVAASDYRLTTTMATVTHFEPLPADLVDIQRQMEGYARGYGLDFYPTIFEVIDADQLNAIAAYGGFPTRYPHWRFGMEYEQLTKGYTYGLQKIYEMVINNDPCYAYLMRSQRHHRPEAGDGPRLRPLRFLQEQLLVQPDQPQDDGRDGQPRQSRPPLHGRFGVEEVETFIDACLSIEDLIDIHSPFIKRRDDADRYDFDDAHDEEEHARAAGRVSGQGLHGSFINPPARAGGRGRATQARSASRRRTFPAEPSATCCCSCWSTRRSSPGSSTCCRSSATRPITSPRRRRPRS